MRWLDPVEGMISPARFIPVAENSGLIGPLGEWALTEACRQAQAWSSQGLPAISMAVNVSLHQVFADRHRRLHAQGARELGAFRRCAWSWRSPKAHWQSAPMKR